MKCNNGMRNIIINYVLMWLLCFVLPIVSFLIGLKTGIVITSISILAFMSYAIAKQI